MVKKTLSSQCTFWCSVLSDSCPTGRSRGMSRRLNAPYGARCFLTTICVRICAAGLCRLNAPYGARCFLTSWAIHRPWSSPMSLNAPYGARCFLTRSCTDWGTGWPLRLNAPFGARCFLTILNFESGGGIRPESLNVPFGARCFLTGGWDSRRGSYTSWS